jgi:hypothetical protein
VVDRYFQAYMSIVGEHGEEIPPHRQFAFDETGIQRGHSERVRVVTGRGTKKAKTSRGGSRETITYIPIISAAGELVNGIVVFPGKIFRKDWARENPGEFG